ncbi:Ca-activated chloride channel family protein [Defluviimonas denitrificans]|jgi:Ca-activated chloride channel family protein|uniref:Ca-activated chloride channel family protein n=1 Tax=Albidovulum denitrificans TaxID=404881 RepID=A0A2S8S692_9RHOB|nr:VWA domain-containing protein [Defluviimonas denitrificans]PQV56316.1 Ca-activated chloride channel family protein [Defluviimonas denitrificans]
MTDDLEQLRQALQPAPAPEGGAKARALRLALENFDRHQASAPTTRPINDRPEPAGRLRGVRLMLSKLTTRAGLAATASVAAIGIALVIYPDLRTRPEPAAVQPATLSVEKAAPAAETAAVKTEMADQAAPAPQPAQDMMLAEPLAQGNAQSAPPLAKQRLRVEGAARMAAPATPAPAMDALAQTESFYPGDAALPTRDTEAYASATPNPLKIAAEDPVSTFSIDTDTASYAVIRSSLTRGTLPPDGAVRVEEMVNYFPYDYPAPQAGDGPFRASVSLFPTPWNKDTQLLRIGIQGAMPAVQDRPPLNLVFLIDTSGSMDDPQKLPLLKQSFRLMLGQLAPEDRVAIVTYAGAAGLVLDPTAASETTKILAALDRLGAGGSTAGQAGLEQAYAVAEDMAADGRTGRILLATDGDFNVGLSDPEALKSYIARKRDSGIYLSVLGFGRGNLDDATMQALAQNGNGTAAYIDTLSEAQKTLSDQLAGALFPIADDVKIQVEFNPATVAEYRLIGYETRALAREDFNNDKVDAGEIGAGHQVTALYEITPVGSPAQRTDALRYAASPESTGSDELAFLKLRYKAPGTATSTLIETPIPATPATPDTDARFAAAIAGMGQLLSDPKYLGGWGWDQAIALANDARGNDPFGYRAEAVRLMRLAQSLSR